ncbi:hypothetical protein [Shouchella patagoniensis]|uniref:hypothetical protein n=1 Tax=Shouchella patagoniensis TaxID=228576 RepID=UPI0009955394|nr:hypothetical protein [Shouchella patagoniensis]
MNPSTTRLTTVQLQQRLIHAQAETAKLKKELERYKNDYHYNLIDELTIKNEELQKELLDLQHKNEQMENRLTLSITNPKQEEIPIEKSDQQHEQISIEKSDQQHEQISIERSDQQPEQQTQKKSDPIEESVFFTTQSSSNKEIKSQSVAQSKQDAPNWFSRSLKSRTKK